jgi:hypothetical protein
MVQEKWAREERTMQLSLGQAALGDAEVDDR